eukprot:Awhi_evm1s6025
MDSSSNRPGIYRTTTLFMCVHLFHKAPSRRRYYIFVENSIIIESTAADLKQAQPTLGATHTVNLNTRPTSEFTQTNTQPLTKASAYAIALMPT